MDDVGKLLAKHHRRNQDIEAAVRELLQIDEDRTRVAHETQWLNIEEGLERMLPIMVRYKACLVKLKGLLDG